MKKDKEKVLDEVWTEDHIRSYLTVQPVDGFDTDFHMLNKAYQSMRADDFAVFLGFFLKEGRNINATDPKGNSVLTLARQHRKSTEFVRLLEENGAAA